MGTPPAQPPDVWARTQVGASNPAPELLSPPMRQENAPARSRADQVLALAPGPAASRAGQALGTPMPWRDTGQSGDPPLIWGSCRWTSRVPYDVCVDVGGPAYRCSCPSYKNPCKHALGLLLLWTAGH